MADSTTQTSKVSAIKETQLDRAQAWVVDQAAISVLKLGRCPIDVIAGHIGITSNTLLAVVQTSDRLTVVDGDLDLAICNDTVARSLDRWCSDVVKAVGCAVHIGELAELLTVHLGKTSEVLASSIKAAVTSTRTNLTLVGDLILLNDWLPMLGHDDQEDILLENGVKSDLVKALLVKAGRGPFDGIQDFTVTLLRSIQNKPIRHKTLAVAFWVLTRGHDSASDFVRLMADDRLLWHSGNKGGRWVLSTAETEYRLLVSDLTPLPEEPIKENPVASPDPFLNVAETVKTVKIDIDLVETIKSDLFTHGQCVNIASYGISDENLQDYVSIVQGFDGVSPVGFGRFILTECIPDINIDAIVECFTCPRVEFISEDGEQVEDLVAPDSYVGTLKADVVHPNNQDVLDDSSGYTGCVASPCVSFPLYKDHLALGVIPMCRLSPMQIPWDVAYAPVSIVVNGEEHACTVINRDGVRCITGLANAFGGELSQSDCTVTVTCLESEGSLNLELSPLLDGEYALTEERCKELDVYKESEADNPTVVILTQILDDHPKGVTFERALRELRYIRRTSVHKLASILSTNDCFAQKPGTGVWRYNPKRADAGNDIARRTYLKSGF